MIQHACLSSDCQVVFWQFLRYYASSKSANHAVFCIYAGKFNNPHSSNRYKLPFPLPIVFRSACRASCCSAFTRYCLLSVYYRLMTTTAQININITMKVGGVEQTIHAIVYVTLHHLITTTRQVIAKATCIKGWQGFEYRISRPLLCYLIELQSIAITTTNSSPSADITQRRANISWQWTCRRLPWQLCIYRMPYAAITAKWTTALRIRCILLGRCITSERSEQITAHAWSELTRRGTIHWNECSRVLKPLHAVVGVWHKVTLHNYASLHCIDSILTQSKRLMFTLKPYPLKIAIGQ